MLTILNATEQALSNFASASLSGSGLQCNFYRGISNDDKAAPACVSVCHRSEELYYGTNIHAVTAELQVKEMAADTDASTIGNLAQTICDPFSDINNRATKLTSFGTSSYFVYAILPQGSQESVAGDAWIQTLELRIICGFRSVTSPVTVTPDFYWTLDEVSGSRVDKVHSIALVPSVAVDSTAGLFANALHFSNSDQSGSIATANVTVPDLTLIANGWSMAGWFKVNGWASAVQDSDPVFKGFANNTNWVAFLEFNSTTSKIHFHVENDSTLFDPAEFTPILGQWYFFHLFYDPILQRVGYSIDNGGPVYDSHTGVVFGGGITTGDPYTFTANQLKGSITTGIDCLIDEMLVNLNGMLTPSQVTYLYNSGTGRTFPL